MGTIKHDIKEKVTDKLFTVDPEELGGILNRLADAINESGQVKINYTGLVLVNFTANVEKNFDINAATPTIVGSPTTTYPKSTPNVYAGVFDSARGTTPVAGRLIENPINGQQHFWRIQGSYANKAGGNNGELQLLLKNPVSGFTYVFGITLPSGRTAGTFNCLFFSIADQASIPAPNGYIITSNTSFTDANLTVEITSITRTSTAFENIIE